MSESQTRPDGAGPLHGVVVLDLSRLLPGGYCSLLLSDLGAEVIKVEAPVVGDYLRHMPPLIGGESAYFRVLNRDKKGMTLNLKHEEGRRIFLELAQKADVVLESYRPGVPRILGVDYETVARANPRIVYCSLTGFGQDGPYRDKPGHDLSYQALAGTADLTRARSGEPVPPGAQVADLSSGALACLGIVAALFRREKTGRGEFIDLSIHDSALSWMIFPISEYLATGRAPVAGRTLLTGGEPCYDVYKTRDGRHLALTALEEKFWQNFTRLVGREDLLEKHFAPPDEKERVRAELAKLFGGKTLAEWMSLLEGKDVCCEPVLNLSEVLSSDHVRHRQVVRGETREEIELHSPLNFRSGSPGGGRRAPALGEHTEEVLRLLGYSREAIVSLREKEAI